jgi:hypothetical protein
MESSAAAADPTHTTPSERVWEINCYLSTEQGLLPDPLELDRAMIACGAILANIGGVMSLGTVREEISPGRVATTRILVKWQSFTPRMQGVVAPVLTAPEPASAEPEAAAASANGNGESQGD